MKTQPQITKLEIKIPTVSVTHIADGIAAFPTSTWKSVRTGRIGKTAGPAMSQHRALPHCSLVKYSTASLDFVFPKKWRPPRLTDPGEVGLRLEPAPERVEGASASLSGSATDQSKSQASSMLLPGWQERKLPEGNHLAGGRRRALSKLREWVDFEGCQNQRLLFSPMLLCY